MGCVQLKDEYQEAAMHGYDDDKAKVIARLRRIEGQVHAITQMVEDNKYCIDVLTQISASNSALKSVALILLDDHLNHCVRQAAVQGGEVADSKLEEVVVGRVFGCWPWLSVVMHAVRLSMLTLGNRNISTAS